MRAMTLRVEETITRKNRFWWREDETGSVQSGMTAKREEETHGFSPVGNIRMKQLTKELRQEERA